jgi:hypothetical protein
MQPAQPRRASCTLDLTFALARASERRQPRHDEELRRRQREPGESAASLRRTPDALEVMLVLDVARGHHSSEPLGGGAPYVGFPLDTS